MLDDNRSIDSEPKIPSPQTLYRGLYVRIASRLKVDPSYVSRVARGERRSPEVEKALREEIEEIAQQVKGGAATKKRQQAADRRLRYFAQKNKVELRRTWLQQAHGDPHIKRVKLSMQKRSEPFLPLLEEQLKHLNFSPKEMATMIFKAANEHGRTRREQGYTSTALVEEYNLLRRCLFTVAEKNLSELDPRLLVQDLGQLGEVTDLQIQSALRQFLK